MPSLPALLADAWRRAGRLLPLAAVPLVVTVADPARLAALLANDDRRFGVTFGFPQDVNSLWSFVDVRPDAVSLVPFGDPALELAFVVQLLVTAVAFGLLTAGYLGSIRDVLGDGRFDFVENVRRYAVPLVGFSLLKAAVGLAAVGVTVAARGLALPLVVSLLVLAYCFYAAPYLVVATGVPLAAALRRSLDLAVSDRRYASFFVQYLAVAAVVSLPVSALAFNGGPPGVVAAAVLTAPVALLLNVATMAFVGGLDVDPPLGAGPTQSNMPVDM